MDNTDEQIGALAAKRLYPLIVGQIAALIITALVLIVVARMLKPSLYGLYSLAFGFQAFIDGVGAWGIGSYLSRELSEHSYKKNFEKINSVLVSGFAIAIAVGIFLTFLGVALSGYAANVAFKSLHISQSSLILVSFITFFMVISTSQSLALVGLKRSDLSAISSVTTDIIQLVTIVLFLTLGYGVNGAIAGMLIGYAIGTILSLYFLLKTVSTYGKFKLHIPTKHSIKHAWDFSVSIAANNFLNTGMQNFAILFLGLYVGAVTLGNFGAALKGLGLLAVIYGTISTVLIPTFSDVYQIKTKEQANKSYNKVINYSLVLVFPLLIYIAIFAKPGLYITVSKLYTTAPLFLTLITIGTLLNLFGTYVSNLLVSMGYTKKVLIYNLISTIFEFIAIVVLVYILPGQQLKVIGAIIASFFIGNIASTILFVKGAKELLKIRFEYKKILNLLVATAALGIILYLFLFATTLLLSGIISTLVLSLLQLIVGVVLTLLIYPAIIVLFKVMNLEDIDGIRNVANKFGVFSKGINFLLNYMNALISK